MELGLVILTCFFLSSAELTEKEYWGVYCCWGGGLPFGRQQRQASAPSVAESYPTSETRDGGWEELPHVWGQGGAWGQGGDQEEQPHAQEVVAVQAQEGLEEPSHIEGQEGQCKEIPLIQGKEQQLCFAEAAVKRYPTPKVRETQVRW